MNTVKRSWSEKWHCNQLETFNEGGLLVSRELLGRSLTPEEIKREYEEYVKTGVK